MAQNYVLKNSKKEFFTFNGAQGKSLSFKDAKVYSEADAELMARAWNKSRGDDMQVIKWEQEALIYYPRCAYHADDALDAGKYVAGIRSGKNKEFGEAIAVKVQGLWFVYARQREEAAV